MKIWTQKREWQTYHTKKNINQARHRSQTKKTTPHDKKQSCGSQSHKGMKTPYNAILPVKQQEAQTPPKPRKSTANHRPMPLHKNPNFVAAVAGPSPSSRVDMLPWLQPFPTLLKQPYILHFCPIPTSPHKNGKLNFQRDPLLSITLDLNSPKFRTMWSKINNVGHRRKPWSAKIEAQVHGFEPKTKKQKMEIQLTQSRSWFKLKFCFTCKLSEKKQERKSPKRK